MKKKVICAALALTLLGGAAAEAKIEDSRIALGGISIGSTEDYVRATYGKPKTYSRDYYAPRKGYVREYNYGDSFFVTVLEETGQVMRMMSMDRHNKIATPDGITIGSAIDDVLRRYGEPDLRQIDGDSDYLWYFGSREKGNLVFRVSFGKVTGITCGTK